MENNTVKELEEYEIITKRTEKRIIIEERIKKHFKENQNKYKIIGLVTMASIAGAVAIVTAYNKVKSDGNIPQPPNGDTKVDKDSIPYVPVKGRRGDAIYNKTRNECYGSKNDAAKVFNTTRYQIDKNLIGKKSAVEDTLQLLGENLTPVRQSI